MIPSTTPPSFYLHNGIKEIYRLCLLKFTCNFTKIINPEGLRVVKISKFLVCCSLFHSQAEGMSVGRCQKDWRKEEGKLGKKEK